MPQPAALNVIGGNDRGKRFDLRVQETRIGRGADQDVVLSDIAVSRRHVTVHLEDGRWRIQDLGSGNGTLVNGQRVESQVLADGDHVEIGQTVMRFEQPGLQAQADPYGTPPPVRPMPPAPSVEQPYGTPPPPAALPSETPSDAAAPPMPRMPPYPTGQQRSSTMINPVATPMRKLMVFGGMGALSVLGLVIIFARTVFATPHTVPSDAEELYKQGVRLFAAGEYDGAKISFGETLLQAPDSLETRRYQRQCEIEIHARAALKSAERSLAGRRYGEAVRALADVDSTSLQADEAARLRRDNTSKAVSEALDEARKIAAEDPDGARARVEQALEINPASDEARALSMRLRAGPLPAAQVAPAEHADKPEKAERDDPPPVERSRPDRHHASRDKDPDLAPVKLPPPRHEATTPSSSGGLSAQALALYKSKDFFGAERAVRQESVNQSPKQFQKTIETANQIKQLKMVIDRASGEETARPDAAIKDYEEAAELDGKLGHGVHGAYFKQKVGKLEGELAQQAFAEGKYEVAFSAAKAAQRAGASDGGMIKQLEAKAAELVQKGQSLQKSNLPQAKSLWHQVMRMVPESSPAYIKAYTLVNNASGSRRDEDED